MALKELPFRDQIDPNYLNDHTEINDEQEALIYQLQMIMLSSKGEVFGDSNFGANLEDLLFTFNANEFTINTSLNEQTDLYCNLADKYRVKFSTKFIQEGFHDVGLIDAIVQDKSVFGLLFK